MWVASDVLVTCVCSRRRSQHQRRENRESPAIAGLYGRTRSPLNYYVPGLECSCLGGVTLPTPANLAATLTGARCPGERTTALVAEWAIRRTSKASDLGPTIAGWPPGRCSSPADRAGSARPSP